MDDPRRLPRRGGHPRRGHPSSTPARPHLPARVAGRPGNAAMTRLTTFADAEATASRAAEEIAREVNRARELRGVAHLALSGGSTPERTYELLADALEDWAAVEIWFADERCVPPEDEESNFRLAKETLLRPAGIDPARVHRMEGELGADRSEDHTSE